MLIINLNLTRKDIYFYKLLKITDKCEAQADQTHLSQFVLADMHEL